VTAAQRRRAARWLGAREPALVHVQRFRAPIDRPLAALGATVHGAGGGAGQLDGAGLNNFRQNKQPDGTWGRLL